MNIFIVLSVLIVLILYISFVLIYIHGKDKRKEIQLLISINKKYKIKTLNFEDLILKKLSIDPNKVSYILYIERFIIISIIVFGIVILRGIALALFGAIAITLVFDDAFKKIIYESGVTNIGRITNFINYFVPHITSGNSAKQSFLGYIEYSSDKELSEYYENIENPDYKLPEHLKEIIDIYDIATYNEEKGISDYTYILNELSQDMAQKQVYYNSFVARQGEIGPIVWSYYIGVPLLVAISFSQTYEFWLGTGGYIISIILLILFTAFKFLIFKLQEKTIKTIF